MKKDYVGYFLAVLVGFLLFWRFGSDNLNALWMQRWALMLAAISLVYSYKIGKVWGYACSGITATTILSGLSVIFWFHRYNDEPFALQSSLRQASAMALLAFIILTVSLRGLPGKSLRFMEIAYGVSGFITSCVIIAWKLIGHDVTRQVPLFDNPSMAASFGAVTLFVLDKHLEYYLRHWAPRAMVWATTIIAVLLTGASTPLLVLMVGTFTMLAMSQFLWFYFIPLAVLPAVGVYVYGAHDLLQSTGRFPLWKWTVQWWSKQAYGCDILAGGDCHWWRVEHFWVWAFGVGTGVMRVQTPMIQVDNGMSVEHGTWMFWQHNDWLTIGIEQGVFGFTALMIFCAAIIWKARQYPYLCATLTAFGAMMTTNFPLHMPMQALFIYVVIRHVLDNWKHNYDLERTRKLYGEEVCR